MSHHSLAIRHRPEYFASLGLSNGAALLLGVIAGECTRGHAYRKSQRHLAELRQRSRRTIIRNLQEVRARGYVQRIRRGKKLTNLYYLAKWLWCRLTGQLERRPASEGRQEWLAYMEGFQGRHPELTLGYRARAGDVAAAWRT